MVAAASAADDVKPTWMSAFRDDDDVCLLLLVSEVVFICWCVILEFSDLFFRITCAARDRSLLSRTLYAR